MKTPAQVRKQKLRQAGLIKSDDHRDFREGFMQHGRWWSCEDLKMAAHCRMSGFDELPPQTRRALREKGR